MSSVVSDDDAEVIDLVTCSVCLCEFDDANRKPKFLPCGHTICLTCLAEIQQNRQIQCPLCRKVHAHSGDVANLPSNNYALRLVREKNQNKASHESLLKLQAELEEMKDRRQTNWAEAIGKRTEIQSYLFLVLNSIKNAEKEIQEKLEENGRVIVELTRQCEGRCERNSSVNPPREKPRVDKTLLELQSLMSSLQLTICPEDSKETIKEKMKTSVEESKQNLTLVSSELDNLQTWKKACLTIQAYNDTNTTVSPIWDTIIEMDWTRTPTSSNDLNLLLMSYMIFSVTKPCVAQDVLTLDTVLAEAHVSTNCTPVLAEAPVSTNCTPVPAEGPVSTNLTPVPAEAPVSTQTTRRFPTNLLRFLLPPFPPPPISFSSAELLIRRLESSSSDHEN
ncbi:E3 ubiquitin-protein ligase TRIM21 [Daphnia magna]|uniref:E3 ubiquitin-protein ligase TRIM21 n=1 Tax=Daphnia magna TaxID=35525 RepID=UPI001E1BDBF2|nr:E3 ubiquitin-protein ligase TRIM21 [Daphnia magna]